jgi:membrane protease YdiL (CAAX protease family)
VPAPSPPLPPDRFGWPPPLTGAPVGWVPAAAPHYTEGEARRDGRLLDRRAGALVAAAIGLGLVMQLVALALAHVSSIEPEALIRYDLVLTLAMYAVVAAMIVSQITPTVRLRWGDGPLLVRIGTGAAVGVGISLVLLALVSAAAGHLRPDPRIVLLMSEGDPTHIIVTVFLTCVAAPLVEETLFRGLLLESLLPRGKATAILVSSGAFAVWHFMPAALVYYLALGAVLGGLYVRRGLAASIAAHVGFNTVLTVAAISIVLGPSHVIAIGGLTMTEPSGWSVASSAAVTYPGAAQLLTGPDDAQLVIVPVPAVSKVDPSVIEQRVRSGDLPPIPGLVLDTNSVREVPTPAGRVVEVSLTVVGRQGTLGFLATGGQAYELVFLSAGSAKAETDFAEMVSSLRAS